MDKASSISVVMIWLIIAILMMGGIMLWRTMRREGFIPSPIDNAFNYRRNIYQPYQVIDREIPVFTAEGQTSKYGQKTPGLQTLREFLKTVPVIAPPVNTREVASTERNYIQNDRGFELTSEEITQITNGVFEKIGGALARFIRTRPTDYQCTHFDECEWELRDTRIYRVSEDDTRFYVDLQQVAFIPGKAWGYAIRSLSSWRKEPRWTQMILHRIEVEGLIVSDQIDLADGYDPAAIRQVEFSDPSLSRFRVGQEKSADVVPILSPSGYTNESSETRVEVDRNTANRLEKLQFLQQKEETDRTGYQCYGKTAFTKFECERSLNNQGYEEAKGIWDRPCKYDYECPFYMANKNYPNYRGGCLKQLDSETGICEMPIGVRRLGSKEYDPNDVRVSALCRNCRPEDGTYCCGRQGDRDRYPLLKSPDWAFEDDLQGRANYRPLFDVLGFSLI